MASYKDVPGGMDRSYEISAQHIVAVKEDGSRVYLLQNGVVQGPATVAVTWATLTGKPSTFPPTVGTTAATAKAGNYVPTWSEITSKPATFPPTVGITSVTAKAGDYIPAWAEITGKPTSFGVALGTTSTTAKAGNYVPDWSEITNKPATFAPTIGITATTAMAGNTLPNYSDLVGKDSGVRSTMKNKPQILALVDSAAGATTANLVTAVNAIIAALKA